MSRCLLALLLMLAACGDLPRPFQGAPGATAMRLARPPPARIAVLPAGDASVAEQPGGPYSQAVAAALQDQEMPAVAEPARAGDWRLVLGAQVQSGVAVPSFTLVDPAGKDQGSEQGKPVPLEIWRQGREDVQKRTATEAAPRIVLLLARVDAARRQSDPRSLDSRPVRVAITGVSGAPGDGDIALARLMRDKLSQRGQVVQESAAGVDFTVTAVVRDTPVNARTRRIEIVWLIHNSRDEEVGKIAQANDVPAGTLDHYWGDVAVVVTEEASASIRDVILSQPGRH